MNSSRTDSPDLPARLAAHRVFGQLDAPAQAALAARLQPADAAAGSLLLGPGELHRRLGVSVV